jgi:hypothetical protein
MCSIIDAFKSTGTKVLCMKKKKNKKKTKKGTKEIKQTVPVREYDRNASLRIDGGSWHEKARH